MFRVLPLLLDLMKDASPLRAAALRGLAGFDDAKIPEVVLARFPEFDAVEKTGAAAAITVDGKLVDYAMYSRAKTVLALAKLDR